MWTERRMLAVSLSLTAPVESLFVVLAFPGATGLLLLVNQCLVAGCWVAAAVAWGACAWEWASHRRWWRRDGPKLLDDFDQEPSATGTGRRDVVGDADLRLDLIILCVDVAEVATLLVWLLAPGELAAWTLTSAVLAVLWAVPTLLGLPRLLHWALVEFPAWRREPVGPPREHPNSVYTIGLEECRS